MTMIDYYLLRARVSFCVCKNSCHVVQKLPCCLSGSSLSSDIATQVTCIVIAQCSSKFSSSDVVTCFLLSGGLENGRSCFSFCLHHTISGVHRVWPKQCPKWSKILWTSKRQTKRRSLILPVQNEAGALTGKTKLLLEEAQKVEEPPKPEQQDSAMEAEAKSLGRHLMETLTSASKSLLECSEKLEKNVVLLEECRADSSSIQSLAAGVNYYASTTKASQAAATANHKQLAWDWLSDPREKQPLKETLKSVRYQCECTSKAAYQVVEVSQEILSELKSHKETMTEQTRLLKLIAGNQVELSKLLKGTATTGGKGQAQPGTAPTAPATPAPSGGTGPMPSAHAAPLGVPETAAPPESPAMPQSWVPQNAFEPSYTPFIPPQTPQTGGPITGKFWAYQPSVAPNYEPNESRNPPTAAYSGQEAPNKKGQVLYAVDRDSGSLRSVSPTAYAYDQTRALNAQYVPRGWMELPSGLHRVYSWSTTVWRWSEMSELASSESEIRKLFLSVSQAKSA